MVGAMAGRRAAGLGVAQAVDDGGEPTCEGGQLRDGAGGFVHGLRVFLRDGVHLFRAVADLFAGGGLFFRGCGDVADLISGGVDDGDDAFQRFPGLLRQFRTLGDLGRGLRHV